MSLRTQNGMGDLPISLITRNGNLPTSSCNSKWKRELAYKFFNSEWNGNFPINKFPMNLLLAPQILNSFLSTWELHTIVPRSRDRSQNRSREREREYAYSGSYFIPAPGSRRSGNDPVDNVAFGVPYVVTCYYHMHNRSSNRRDQQAKSAKSATGEERREQQGKREVGAEVSNCNMVGLQAWKVPNHGLAWHDMGPFPSKIPTVVLW